jgi:hypothetical protein
MAITETEADGSAGAAEAVQTDAERMAGVNEETGEIEGPLTLRDHAWNVAQLKALLAEAERPGQTDGADDSAAALEQAIKAAADAAGDDMAEKVNRIGWVRSELLCEREALVAKAAAVAKVSQALLARAEAKGREAERLDRYVLDCLVIGDLQRVDGDEFTCWRQGATPALEFVKRLADAPTDLDATEAQEAVNRRLLQLGYAKAKVELVTDNAEALAVVELSLALINGPEPEVAITPDTTAIRKVYTASDKKNAKLRRLPEPLAELVTVTPAEGLRWK